MRIKRSTLKRIIAEEKYRLLKESPLDDPGGITIPPEELIAKVEKIMDLVRNIDGYLTAHFRGEPEMVDVAFEANGDVEYHLQQLTAELKGL